MSQREKDQLKPKQKTNSGTQYDPNAAKLKRTQQKSQETQYDIQNDLGIFSKKSQLYGSQYDGNQYTNQGQYG